MTTYSTYKATGSRWVGRVPEHWTLLRAKHFLREIDDRTTTGEETLLSMRQHRGLVPHNDVSAKRIAAKHLVGYKKARPDELVLNRMQAGNAMFFRNGRFGLVSPDYAVFRLLRDDNPHYLGYLFRSRPMCGLFRSESKGLGTGTSGFLRLYSDRFAALPMALPSRPEQDQIVAYLRAQDAHIAAAGAKRVQARDGGSGRRRGGTASDRCDRRSARCGTRLWRREARLERRRRLLLCCYGRGLHCAEQCSRKSNAKRALPRANSCRVPRRLFPHRE